MCFRQILQRFCQKAETERSDNDVEESYKDLKYQFSVPPPPIPRTPFLPRPPPPSPPRIPPYEFLI